MSSDGPPKQKCPNCSIEVEMGTVECPNCGTNVKSGETFDTKLKRARVKEGHAERYMRHVFLGIFLAFGLIILAGFFTQRGAEEFIRGNSEKFRKYAEQIAQLDALIAQNKPDEAEKLGEALIKTLEKEEDATREGASYEHNPTSKGKKFLGSLRKVVQHKLEGMRR